MDNLINVSDISFSYNNQKILNKVSLSVEKNDFVVIIGPNGAGKSTLVKLLLKELTPSHGKISLFNQDISNFRDWYRLGYVAQNSSSLANGFIATTKEIVEANLYHDIGLFKFAKKQHDIKTLAALDKVGLLSSANTLINNLSGGQQQRVMLARVLVNNPELMILDEPTNAIDESSIKSLYELLGKLNKENNLAIVMITHDIHHTLPYATKYYCIEAGSLVELTKQQVIQEQANKHTHNHDNVEVR